MIHIHKEKSHAVKRPSQNRRSPFQEWRQSSLVERIKWLRIRLPTAIILTVTLYQLMVARTLERQYGHFVHYSVEIAFYSLVGPVITWLTLVWIERELKEKEQLERQIRVRTQQLASLTETSPDAIVSLNHQGEIISWNQGAKEIFGYLAAEIINQPLGRLLTDPSTLDASLGHEESVRNFVTSAITQDGAAISVDLTHTHIAEESADAPVSLLIMRDITARREREAILEEERARIARDLHDGVAQTLYFLALKADMAHHQLVEHPQEAGFELKEIGREARQVIREVRRTIFALRPLDWPSNGFLPALRTFAEGFAEQLGWQIDIQTEVNEASIPKRLEPTIFRLIQESLNNVAKHAGATQVWITLRHIDKNHQISLVVRDNGAGFELTEIGQGGLGLNQMQQRVSALGGTFKVESEKGGGTTVAVQLPTRGGNDGNDESSAG